MFLKLIIVDAKTFKNMSTIQSIIRYLSYLIWISIIFIVFFWLIFTGSFPRVGSIDAMQKFSKSYSIVALGVICNILLFIILSFFMSRDKRKQGIHDKLANTVVIRKYNFLFICYFFFKIC